MNNYLLIILLVFLFIDLFSILLMHEVFALPKQSNKQQETYTDIITHYTCCKCSMDRVIPIGIYCYFGFDLIEKLRSFLLVKRRASINAI